LYLVNSPYILTRFSQKWIYWDVKDSSDTIFLTFDDGPIPEVTPEVLAILKNYNAKATFFMVGENVKRYPEVYQQVIDQGHAVGNHSFNHLKAFSTPNKDYFANIEKASKYIDSKLFRPPHGQITPSQIRKLSKSYRIIMWSVLSGDFDAKINADICSKNVIENTKSGSIVVFHDSLKAERNMLPALENTLAHFSKKGFQFKSLKDI
jgi:peptidoglycan/xylan/chitin deacetylase (PgdA/CDA1 family)